MVVARPSLRCYSEALRRQRHSLAANNVDVKRFSGSAKRFAATCIRMAGLDACASADLFMPNIYDVAKRARVSVATVSAVLNDSAFVSADLKSRVRAAVDALGYQPNLLARSMAKQRTQTLGMIVPDIANPFFPEVVRGAEDTRARGRLHAADRQQRQRPEEGRGLPAPLPGETG